MDMSFAFLFLGVVHGLIFLALIVIWFLAKRTNFRIFRPPLSRAKSLIEQRLVLEALSACAAERGKDSTIGSIGKHAAEVTGFEDWAIWLEEGERFYFHSSGIELSHQESEELRASYDPQLYAWVRQNAAPLRMGRFIAGFVSEGRIKELLQHLSNGYLLPFADGDDIVGFAVVGGRRLTMEQRSDQFLSLFGAIAAIIIKKAELDRQEQILRRKQSRAESLAALGNMAARLAHEIRNPLTFIRSATDYLSEGKADAEKRATMTRGISEEIERINQRVEELLTLGRVDPEGFEPVDICGLVARAASLAESRARESGAEIVTTGDSDAAVIMGDGDRLLQLFENLIINGLQAMDTAGKITLRCSQADSEVVVDIEDSGKGIPTEIAERIFDPFFSTKERGTGLGLAIGYSVARAHGGSLELVRSDDSGSLFRVKLPLRKRE